MYSNGTGTAFEQRIEKLKLLVTTGRRERREQGRKGTEELALVAFSYLIEHLIKLFHAITSE
jgi:hypothetical protein